MNLREKAFELITELAFQSCGDGDAAIVSEFHKDLADAFEIWANVKHPGRFTRTDHADGAVSFSSEPEENIFFHNKDEFPSWVGNKLIHPDL
jgi:hypothetical protein